MLNAAIRFSLTYRAVVFALTVVLLAIGGYVATTMPVDVFPDLTAPTVTVITEGAWYGPR